MDPAPPRLGTRARIGWGTAAVLGLALTVICILPAQALWDMSFDEANQGVFEGPWVMIRWSSALTPVFAGLFAIAAARVAWRGRGWRVATAAALLTVIAFATAAWIVGPVLFGFGSGSTDG